MAQMVSFSLIVRMRRIRSVLTLICLSTRFLRYRLLLISLWNPSLSLSILAYSQKYSHMPIVRIGSHATRTLKTITHKNFLVSAVMFLTHFFNERISLLFRLLAADNDDLLNTYRYEWCYFVAPRWISTKWLLNVSLLRR